MYFFDNKSLQLFVSLSDHDWAMWRQQGRHKTGTTGGNSLHPTQQPWTDGTWRRWIYPLYLCVCPYYYLRVNKTLVCIEYYISRPTCMYRSWKSYISCSPEHITPSNSVTTCARLHIVYTALVTEPAAPSFTIQCIIHYNTVHYNT